MPENRPVGPLFASVLPDELFILPLLEEIGAFFIPFSRDSTIGGAEHLHFGIVKHAELIATLGREIIHRLTLVAILPDGTGRVTHGVLHISDDKILNPLRTFNGSECILWHRRVLPGRGGTGGKKDEQEQHSKPDESLHFAPLFDRSPGTAAVNI
jgi:hypothetical protein